MKHHISTVPRGPQLQKAAVHYVRRALKGAERVAQSLMEKAFIIPPSSPIAAPLFFVGKKSPDKESGNCV